MHEKACPNPASVQTMKAVSRYGVLVKGGHDQNRCKIKRRKTAKHHVRVVRRVGHRAKSQSYLWNVSGINFNILYLPFNSYHRTARKTGDIWELTERERQRDRDRDRQTETERQRETETERQRQTDRDRVRDRETERQRQRDRQRHRDTETETETETETDRQTDRQRQRQRERERERSKRNHLNNEFRNNTFS